MNSPDKLDLTYKFWNVGSIQAETPIMFEIVAVGAMATQLEFRIPCCLMLARNEVQSILLALFTVK